jgi:hypothetical protein
MAWANDLSTSELFDQVKKLSPPEADYLLSILAGRVDGEAYLARLLHETDGDQRLRLIRLQSRHAGPAVVAALAEALNDPDRRIRQAAAGRLGDIGSARSVEPLIAAATDENASVRREAISALAQIGDPRATPVFIQSLLSPDDDVRLSAVMALYRMRDPASIQALTAALGDASSPVRTWAARGLGRLARPASDQGLIRRRVPRDQWLYRSWLSNPTLDAGSEIYTFQPDGTGSVEDFHMGITRDFQSFDYRVSAGSISFLFAGRSAWVDTRFTMERSTYADPMEGARPCLTLAFEAEPYFFTRHQVSLYYSLLQPSEDAVDG